ncbi:hypothetical protein [Actinoplanes missouriensis]|nr:hypothetical protein [Actinoplanes missouriensis]
MTSPITLLTAEAVISSIGPRSDGCCRAETIAATARAPFALQ